MNILSRNNIEALERKEKYNEYYVQLKFKDQKTIGRKRDFEIFSDERTVCVVDIVVSKNGVEYEYNNYYIGTDVSLSEVGNIIAERIINKLNDITFSDAKYIGTIRDSEDGLIVADDETAVLNLRNETQNDYDDNIYGIYTEYTNLNKLKDKNTILKYAAFLEMKLTPAIPNAIRGEAFNEQVNLGHLSTNSILDYSELDKMIKEKLSCSIAGFKARREEMKKDFETLDDLNNQLEELAAQIRGVENILPLVEELIGEIERVKQREKKKKQLEEASKNLPLFSSKKREIRTQLSEIDKSEKSDDKSKEYILKNKIIRTLHESGLEDNDISDIIGMLTVEELEKYLEQLKEKHDKKRYVYNDILEVEKRYNPKTSLEVLREETEKMSFDELETRLYDNNEELEKRKGY